MKNKTILITGGTGYLGSLVVRRLLADGANVIVLKRSFSNTARIQDLSTLIRFINIDEGGLEGIFTSCSVDTIIHCATNYGRASTKPTQLIEANLMLPLQLLQLAVQYGVRSFINTDTVLDTRVNYYALSKGHFCDWLKTFSSKIVCCNVALEHFYGPLDDTTKFVSFIVQEMLKSSKCINLTPGEQKRDFVYVDDVVNALILITQSVESVNSGFFRFEVGSGSSVSIRDVVEKIRLLSNNRGIQVNYGAIPYRENEVMMSNVDLLPLIKLGWAPLISLDHGLNKTILADRAFLESRSSSRLD